MPGERDVDLWSLSNLCTPWCVHVVATLRVAEHIGDGNVEIKALGTACQADPESLGRVLRHLVGKGLFEEPTSGVFSLNEPARQLLEPPMRLGLDLDGFGGRMAHAWGSLLAAVRSGSPAYHTVFGRPFWDDLQAHPEIAEGFDSLMGPPGHGRPDPNVLLEDDWDSVTTVVDVGGGTGALLAEVLRDRPSVRGILVDLPSTVARAGKLLKDAGIADRVMVQGQSFFDPLPSGGDLYLLKSVLSDWPDREARLILQRCAEAARPQGRVVILNGISPDEAGEPDPELLMMVLVGGKDRSLKDFRELTLSVGLEVTRAGRRPSGRYTVECTPIR
ncbi:methyltransferase [Singulisphaera sp. PoT]|uniref:methyltransferase n=1 Tax=Singulisphaera sp. PoT TaxID=3411797 RepID=UPI003BF58D28